MDNATQNEQRIYWHRELPPLTAEVMAEHTHCGGTHGVQQCMHILASATSDTGPRTGPNWRTPPFRIAI